MMLRSLRRLSPQSLAILLIVLFGAAAALSVDVSRLDASDGGTQRAQEAQAGDGARFQATEPADELDLAGTGGERGTATVTVFVWDDLDEDGRQDAGEPGIAGKTVQLWNSTKTNMLELDTTNSSGYAVLSATTPGSYRLRVLLSGGDVFSPKDNPSAGASLDSDFYEAGTNYSFSDTFSLTAQMTTITSYDAGIIRFKTATPTRTPTPINVGNFVWDDYDQDGRQDAGEPGLQDVVVQIWNGAKTQMIDQTTTNASGIYSLQVPGPGQYRVRVLLPDDGEAFSPKNIGSGASPDQNDSDINPTEEVNFGFTDVYDFASNLISITTIDAGIIIDRPPTATRTPTPINVGNFVWNDTNANGVQDGGEVGLRDITVQLWNAAMDTMIDETQTNASGIYSLVAPTPGQYRVRVLKPSGSSFSPKNVGSGASPDQNDSDINTNVISSSYGYTDIYDFGSNLISITTIDAGLYNVPATATPMGLPSGDTLAVYSKKKGKISLIDTLDDKPPTSAYTAYVMDAPVKGSFVMGDWNGDNQKTPGLFKDGFFWYTNQIGLGAAWSQVWTGLTDGKFVLVAGKFSIIAPNDCIGLVQTDFDSPDEGFPLYYTCQLGAVDPPNGIFEQWLGGAITTETGKYQFVVGDWNNDGLDSVAIRRGDMFTFTNTAPSQGTAAFVGTQFFGDPYDGYGLPVAGDWDGDGDDSFGLYFHGEKPRFYYRNDLGAGLAQPIRQRLKNKAGGKPFADSWRELTEVRVDNALLPLPDAPSQPEQQPPALTPTLTPTPSYISSQPATTAPTATPTVELPLPTQTAQPSLPPSQMPQPTEPPPDTPQPTFSPTATDARPSIDATATAEMATE